MKSFYEILEVPEWASAAEIRSAYLKLAREYHPDRVPEHLTKLRADAEGKFKQVQEAWAVLGDPKKRRRYDLRAQGGPPLYSAQPAPPKQPAITHPPVDPLGRKRDLVKLALVVVVMTLVFVVLGEVFVYRGIYHETATRPVWKFIKDAKAGGLLNTGLRQYNTQPRHIRTWSIEGGSGLDVQLLSVAVQRDGLEVSFRVRAGEHGDLLLYEPPDSRDRVRSILGKEVAVDRDLEEIYIQDNTGEKFYSTSGLVGGQQVNFNLYNFIRRINFRSREEVILLAKFPPIAASANSITFVSPALGKWQPAWRWPAIELR
jgi:curved DNA-binding protein CbpA